jgi:hypothetical protein
MASDGEVGGGPVERTISAYEAREDGTEASWVWVIIMTLPSSDETDASSVVVAIA